MTTSSMTAAMYDRYGSPEVIYLGQAARPSPKPGEVLVRVRALSVNGGELAARAGHVRFLTGHASPKRLGLDFTGEVAELGQGVTDLAVGQRVWGIMGRTSGFGSAAQYVSVPAQRVGRVPEQLDLVEAAALPVATTAVTALHDKAAVQAAERVLIRGAAGGVGHSAVQLVSAAGAHATAMARETNHDFIRQMGADAVVDHRSVTPDQLGRFDVIVDTVGSDLTAYRRLLNPGGRMVTIAFDLNRPLASLGSIAASALRGRQRIRFFSGNPTRPDFDRLASLVIDGALRPAVDTVFPLERIADAHRAMEAGGVRGKYVVSIP